MKPQNECFSKITYITSKRKLCGWASYKQNNAVENLIWSIIIILNVDKKEKTVVQRIFYEGLKCEIKVKVGRRWRRRRMRRMKEEGRRREGGMEKGEKLSLKESNLSSRNRIPHQTLLFLTIHFILLYHQEQEFRGQNLFFLALICSSYCIWWKENPISKKTWGTFIWKKNFYFKWLSHFLLFLFVFSNSCFTLVHHSFSGGPVLACRAMCEKGMFKYVVTWLVSSFLYP